MKGHTVIALAALLAACSKPAPPPPADTPPDALPLNGAFVGRVWMSTTPEHALGAMVVFLPNRTLLMDSCFETFRLSEWGVAGEHIRWREDTIPVETALSMPSANELTLQIVGQRDRQTYIAASVPFVCPDMPK